MKLLPKTIILICTGLVTILFNLNEVTAQCNACADTYIAEVSTTLVTDALAAGGLGSLTREDFEDAINENYAAFEECMDTSCGGGRPGQVRRRCRRLCRDTARRIKGLALLGDARRIPANVLKRRFRRRCRRDCR